LAATCVVDKIVFDLFVFPFVVGHSSVLKCVFEEVSSFGDLFIAVQDQIPKSFVDF